VLRLLRKIGVEYGLTVDDMSYISIQSILKLYSTTEDPEEVIKGSIECGKRKAAITSMLTLPPVIISQEDIYAFEYPDTEPNYITSGEVTAEVVEITGDSISESACRDISGKIVLIKSADPGYDWIFSHKIAGFITQYGGANSHMAIRAGELSIPAAVGVGEKLFNKVRRSQIVELDARQKTIRVLRR
jgi:phosphohistidine swiveling domain-containing protein